MSSPWPTLLLAPLHELAEQSLAFGLALRRTGSGAEFRKAWKSLLMSPWADVEGPWKRASICSAMVWRFQPGTVAPRLTSRHLGWRGAIWNWSHLRKAVPRNVRCAGIVRYPSAS